MNSKLSLPICTTITLAMAISIVLWCNYATAETDASPLSLWILYLAMPLTTLICSIVLGLSKFVKYSWIYLPITYVAYIFIIWPESRFVDFRLAALHSIPMALGFVIGSVVRIIINSKGNQAQ